MAASVYLQSTDTSERTSRSDQLANATPQPAPSNPQAGSAGTVRNAQGSLPATLPGDSDTPSASANTTDSAAPDRVERGPGSAVTGRNSRGTNGSASSAIGASRRAYTQSAAATSNARNYYRPSHAAKPQTPTFGSREGASSPTERPSPPAPDNAYDRYTHRPISEPSGATANNSYRANAGREFPTASAPGNAPETARPSSSVASAQGQAALNAWRAQTTPPASASSANLNRQTESAPRVERDQDLYARRNTAANPAASTNQNARLEQEPKSLEMPSSFSSPVVPSLPLAGIPSGSVGANSQFRAIRIPPELQSKSSQLVGRLQIGQLMSSYSPAYPANAARDGIEGTVKLSVIVGKDGGVRKVQVLSGPAMLTSAADAAVRDWRYGETFLAGQPIETEQYVTIVFRLSGK
jgi:TonB family protein